MSEGAASREPVVVEVESSISKVVVYNDRAQVTRKAEAEVMEGESKVVFTDLPLGINRDAIQVFVGEGVKCEMRGVTYKSPSPASLLVAPEPEKTEDFEKLEEEIRLSDEKMAVLTEKKNICENNLAMVNAITGLAVKEGPKWDVGKYQELLSFQRKHREDGQKEIRVLSDELVALRKVHADLLTRQQVEGMKASKPTAKIEVSVLCQSPGTLRLSLAYLVNGAGWKPHYDFRVDGATKEVNISYHGIVTQQTGESWEDVQVQLSTAKPNLGGKQPELNPWRISLQPSHQIQQRNDYDLGMSNVMPMQQMMSAPARASNMFVPPPPSLPGAPPAVTGSTVAGKSSSTSVIFKVAGTHTIPSTGDETRVSIAVETFPAHFRYSTVPKLSQHAFLKAKIVNSSEFPFLAGAGSVFLDNALVAPTEIDVVPPGQDFWLFLGVDEAIGIKIKFIKREDREEGSMVTGGKRNKTILSYQIRIKNNKRTREEIVVWDQLPIPDSKDITVKMVDPELNPENPHFKKDENEYVEWFFELKPGQEVVQPFVYSVEAAKNVSIYGLEHLQ